MSDNGRPVFQQVYYLNPFATMPPGWSQTGVVVSVDNPTDSANVVLAGRLRIGGTEVMVALGATPTLVRLLPSAPLSATASYAIDVQWVPPGTDPNNINWSNTSITATAPVVTSYVQLVSGQLDAGVLRLAFELGVAGTTPTGANLTVFDDRGRSAAFSRVEGGTGDVSFTPQEGRTYDAYLQAVMPIAGSGTGTFEGPYTMGPVSPGIPLSVAAPGIAGVGYDGDKLQVSWQAPDALPDAGPLSYQIVAQKSDGAAVEAEAGPEGGSVFLGIVGETGWSVAGRASQGRVGGLLGDPVDVLTAQPTVSGVHIADGKVVASVALPDDVPTGVTVRGFLLADATVVSGPVDADNGTLTFDFDATGSQGLSIVAQPYSSENPSLTGPRGPASPVLGQAPRLQSVLIQTDATDAEKWAIQVSWSPADDPQVTSYELALNGDTPVTTHGTSATLSVAKSDITDPNNAVTVAAVGVGNSRSPAAEQAVLFAGPLLTGTSVTDGDIQANWEPPSPNGGLDRLWYVAVLYDTTSGAPVFRSAPISALTVSVPLQELPLVPTGSYAVGLQVVSGVLLFDAGSDGTAKTRAPLQLDPVAGLKSTTDPISGTVTLTWTEIDGASGYRVLVGNAEPATVTTNSYDLPSAPPPNQDLAVRVAGDRSQDDVSAAGPYSNLFPLLTTQTALTSGGYDGTNVGASWVPIGDVGGYLVSVLESGSTDPAATVVADATASSVSVALEDPDTSRTYTVVVQVLSAPAADADSGPPSPGLDVFTPAFFPSRVPASTASPYVFPARTLAEATAVTLGTSGPDIVLYLPDLAGGSGLQGLPVASSGDSFTLAESGGSLRPYKLTIAGAAWSFGASPMRSDLAGEYVDFLKSVENAGSVPWGISQLQLAIARAMPQTFQELLYYSYGLAFAGGDTLYGSVDLRPGMVLRVSSSDYMSLGGTSTQTWLAGYTGTSVNDYEVGSYQGSTGWMVGMDAFLAQLVANGSLSVDPPPSDPSAGQEGGLAESADLFYPGFQQPFYRLFIPSSLLPPSQTGSTSTAANFTLAAAANYTALTTAVNVPSSTSTVAYFRGRSVLKILIRVRLNGAELLVPLGTTVGNLLDRLASRPSSIAAPVVGLELRRNLGPIAFSESADLDAGQSWLVQFAWDGLQVYGPAWSALSMPLLHGDSLSIGSLGAPN